VVDGLSFDRIASGRTLRRLAIVDDATPAGGDRRLPCDT
jgi:hypothetical protein